MRARLALADGLVLTGTAFGAIGENGHDRSGGVASNGGALTGGEVVFNTSMTGYQEILTDPSYAGQIVTMTYPLIGNYGVNDEDAESAKPQVAGFVVRERSRMRSNWRSDADLDDYLAKSGIVGIEGIDTRMVVKRLRTQGSMNGVIATGDDLADEELVAKAREVPSMAGLDLASTVTCAEPCDWPVSPPSPGERRFKVAAFDYGIKRNILRQLAQRGCEITVFPAGTPAADILVAGPDGVFLSNGPGDPEPVTYAVETIKGLLGKVPVFGICLGNQLLGLALGARTYKLKFGHRGGNHPVLNRLTGKVEITAQNHGFCVDLESLGGESPAFGRVEYSHENLNDHTVEGMRCLDVPAFSVQYHPESAPGPHDSRYLFDEFIELMSSWAGRRPELVGKRGRHEPANADESVRVTQEGS